MAEIRGIIVKKQGERAEVKVDKAESELTGLPKYIDCWNPVGAKAGDVVGAEYRDFDQTKAKMIISMCKAREDEKCQIQWRFTISVPREERKR